MVLLIDLIFSLPQVNTLFLYNYLIFKINFQNLLITVHEQKE
jgi:hypothetical protein